jgi:hypothetical protein
MNTKKIISSITIGVGAIIIGLGIQYVLADWTQAPPNPPQNNVPAPINVGSSAQAKVGGLVLGSATLPTGGLSNGILSAIGVGTQIFALYDSNSTLAKQNCAIGSAGCENGYVLMNDGSGNGIWVSTSSLAIGGSGPVQPHGSSPVIIDNMGNNHSWTVPTGVSSFNVRICGGGGGGSAAFGHGGAAGNCTSQQYTASPGQVYSIASGGSQGTGGQNNGYGDCSNPNSYGTAGENTYLVKDGSNILTATGGAGGSPFTGCSGTSTQGGSIDPPLVGAGGYQIGAGGDGGVNSGGGQDGTHGGGQFTW